jgi:nucleoid-associated protein YgaU
MKKSLIILLFVFGLAAQSSYDYENMTKEQYAAELAKWRNDLSEAEAKIAEIDKQMAELDKEITANEKQAKDAYIKTLAKVNIDEEKLNSYNSELNTLKSDIEAFLAQSPEEAYKNRRQIKAFENRLAELKKTDASILSGPVGTIAAIENLIAQAKEKSTLPNTMYEVAKGDYLWKIAAKNDVYGDAYAWVRLYNANKSLISNPDIIQPKWMLTVPRSVDANQYLVRKGDNLYKISKEFGGVFTWVKLHQANSNIIEDANLIFPYQVLTVPGE